VSRVRATYRIETAFPLEVVAAAMAGEQSTGTFLKLVSEDDPLVLRQAATVEGVSDLGPVAGASLPGAKLPKGRPADWRQAIVELSWPLDNFGPSLPNLISTVAGNLFELNQLSAIRMIDLDLPKAFLDRYPGPAFGPNGTRRLAGVEKFPLIGTIIKPSVGLTPAATADLVKTLVGGGINFIKDDELQADGPLCPFEDRVKAVMPVVNAAADAQGQKPMVAFNLTGEIDEMRHRHDIVVAAGGTCVMVSLNSVGLVGVAELRRHSELPIHAHRNGWGLYYRSPHIGIDYRAYQKIWRVLGVDHMHVNGLRNKFAEDGASSIASAKACLKPLSETDPRLVMPVFSSGQWAGQVPETYAALGSADLIYCCGGGIVAHPQGVKAGVESIREAWAAAFDGESLESRARSKPALAAALAFFQ
jgi:ribulose-bisphosphate carboxylase large chain